MISLADVRALTERPPSAGSPVLSVYLDVDQSRAVNLNREFVAVLRSRLRALERSLAGSEQDAFRADAARVERVVAHYEPHAGTLILFADDSAGFLWHGEIRPVLATDVR